MKRTALSDWFRRYLTVRRCPGCGVLLDPSEREDLCPACLPAFSETLAALCPVCGMTAPHCRCRPAAIRRLENVVLLSLFFYRQYDGRDPADRMLYALKRQEDTPALPFLARALAQLLEQYAAEQHLSLERWLLVYPPRSAAARRRYGFDQAARLTGRIARLLSMPHACLFRRAGGTEQKTATAAERQRNADDSLTLRRQVPRSGFDGFILLDDVVTTGATVTRCVSLLREQTDAPCLIVSLARTVRTAHSASAMPAEPVTPPVNAPMWFDD